MRGKPIELERLDMGQRSRAPQPGNVGDDRVRTEIEKDALSLEAPGATLHQPSFDSPGRNETALAQE